MMVEVLDPGVQMEVVNPGVMVKEFLCSFLSLEPLLLPFPTPCRTV